MDELPFPDYDEYFDRTEAVGAFTPEMRRMIDRIERRIGAAAHYPGLAAARLAPPPPLAPAYLLPLGVLAEFAARHAGADPALGGGADPGRL